MDVNKELLQKAKTIPQEQRFEILYSLSNLVILKNILRYLLDQKEIIDYEIDEEKEVLYYNFKNETGIYSTAFFIYREDIKAKTLPNLEILKQKIQSFKNCNKYILIHLGERSQKASRELHSLRDERLEIKDIEWLDEFFLERLPHIFYDSEKVPFLQKIITELETSHWLAKKGLMLSEIFTEPFVLTIEIESLENFETLREDSIKIKKFPLEALKNFLPSNQKILLTGEPGSGKTSALSKLIINSYKECISKITDNLNQIFFLPILFKAINFLKIQNSKDIYNFFPENLRGKIQLQSILIDGLDEVSETDRKKIIETAVQITNELQISLIISSRTDQLSLEITHALKRYDLLPFSFSQSFSLLKKIVHTGKIISKDFTEVKNIIEESIQKLGKNITLTPISVILLAELIEKEKEIPASIVELYDKYLEQVLGTFDKAKGLQVIFDYPIKAKFLSHLAFEKFYKQDKLEISKQEFINYLNEFNNKFGSLSNLQQFQEELKRSQILVFEGDFVYFRHRSFLEYFVGVYIYKNRDNSEFSLLNDYLVNLYFSNKWSEVTLYYFGLITEVKQEFLEKLFDYKKSHKLFSFFKLLSGTLLQAGWHSESNVKKFGITKAIQYADELKDFFLKEKSNYTESFLYDSYIIYILCEESFSSTFLHQQNKEVLDILIQQSSSSYLQVLGLFSANKRFMNYTEKTDLVYKVLEKIENDKNLSNHEKIKYLLFLDLMERETKQLRRTIRKKLKKKLGKNLFFNPPRSFEKQKKEIVMLEQKTYVESITLENFTCFYELNISFVEGINFIIGENSTGKTHLLKIIYSILSGLHQAKNFSVPIKNEIGEQLLAKEIVEVFKPDFLGRLCSREKSEIYLSIKKTDEINNDYSDIYFYFTKEEKESIKIESLTQNIDIPSILFIPVKEVLSFTTYFIDYYENHLTEFDKTYYNLLKALSRAPLKKDSEKYKAVESLLSSLKLSIGGEVFKKEHKFYILEDSGERESSLIAEGQRKLAMLYYLILTDNLKKGDILIWDEPDSSLNPKMIQNLAQALVELAQRGIQIFITSHNLFFMKELDNLRLKSKEKLNIKYFSFVKSKNQILVEEGSKLTDLNTIVSLDESLLQEDRRQELLDQLEASND